MEPLYLGIYSKPFSLLFFSFGIFLIYIGVKKQKQNKFTKCPNCKESFNYSELKDGKCKYCKDIDTVDIEEYYKNNPDEKE